MMSAITAKRTTAAHRSGGCCGMLASDGGAPVRGRAARSRRPGASGSAVGRDDPAHRAAAPVDLGIRVLRPADLDAHPRPFGAGRAIDDLAVARLSRAVLAGDGAVADDPLANAGRMAEQRQLIVVQRHGRTSDRRQLLRRAYWASKPSFHFARCSCQMPRPIIIATAAMTTIVGTMGRRRIIRRSALRARGAYIPGRAAMPSTRAGRRSSALRRPGSRPGAPTRAVRRRRRRPARRRR